MIWFGTIGTIYPIGYTNSNSTTAPRSTITMGNPAAPTTTTTTTVFSLYNGPNDSGQEVFTWIAATNTTSFSGDISPAVTYLYEKNLIPVNKYVSNPPSFPSEILAATFNPLHSNPEYPLSLLSLSLLKMTRSVANAW